jgi:hypothetical protein
VIEKGEKVVPLLAKTIGLGLLHRITSLFREKAAGLGPQVTPHLGEFVLGESLRRLLQGSRREQERGDIREVLALG